MKSFGQTAIVFAIPGRMDAPASPFVTWEQLRTLHASGVIDVQSHTFSHARVFTGSQVFGFVTPQYRSTPFLNRPQLAPPPALRFVTPDDLGAPLYTARSRMSDGRRIAFSPDVHDRCVERVAREGGEAFFNRPDWRASLTTIARSAAATTETDAQQQAAIEKELAAGRDELNARLGTTSGHGTSAFPGVCQAAARLRRCGASAIARRLRIACAGSTPSPWATIRYWLKRLPNKYISSLPGYGRRTWL